MKLDIKDMKNKSLRKTPIFKNISQPKNWESWDESKGILIKETKSVMPAIEETVILDKIENQLRIIVKFNDWQLTKTSKLASSEWICRYVLTSTAFKIRLSTRQLPRLLPKEICIFSNVCWQITAEVKLP